jgi:predicted DNA-binding protein (MmcQ/YjbR family)
VLVVAGRPQSSSKESRIFEQAHLARLKKCSETVAHAERLIEQAKRYVEQSKELVVATLPKKKRFG